MNKDEIRDSVTAAIESSAQPLTQILRQNAQAAGWDPEAANTLTVEADGTALSVKSDSKRAGDLEYGTDEARPNRAVHRFSNRAKVIESTILAEVNERLRGVL